MIILPTLRRPHLLKQFIQAYHKTEATLPICVVLDANDARNYDSVVLPAHWQKTIVPLGTKLDGIYIHLVQTVPDAPYYAMIGDDVRPESLHWDITMRDACLPDKIVWGWDSIQNEKLPTHPFIGGDLVRRLGWFAAPGMKQYFVDNVWKNLADKLGCGVYLPDVKMRHCHYLNGDRQRDRTDDEAPSMSNDERAYYHFMNNDFAAAVARAQK